MRSKAQLNHSSIRVSIFAYDVYVDLKLFDVVTNLVVSFANVAGVQFCVNCTATGSDVNLLLGRSLWNHDSSEPAGR